MYFGCIVRGMEDRVIAVSGEGGEPIITWGLTPPPRSRWPGGERGSIHRADPPGSSGLVIGWTAGAAILQTSH